MAEFITIKECIQSFLRNPDNKNHSFICTVIKASDLKSGTKDDHDWTKKVYTVEDSTDQLDITTWGDEINLLKIGYKYEITQAYFSAYKDNVQVGLRYAQVKVIGSTTAQTTMPDPTPKPLKAGTKSIPEMDATHAQTVRANTLLMIQIEKEVKAVLKDMSGEEPRGDKVGMYTRMNFYFLKGMDAQD